MPETAAGPEPHVLIEAYYDAGWTDGLPVVPPTDASVAAMLAGAGLRGHEVLGEIPGRNTVVTADKVAINAVMAGCRPEYAPVVVAALRGLCRPEFAYHGPASSTGGSAMVLIVNSSCRAANNSLRNFCGSSFTSAMTRCSIKPTSRAISATISASRRAIEETIAYITSNGELGCNRPLSIRAAIASVSRSAASNETLALIGPCTVTRKSSAMN